MSNDITGRFAIVNVAFDYLVRLTYNYNQYGMNYVITSRQGLAKCWKGTQKHKSVNFARAGLEEVPVIAVEIKLAYMHVSVFAFKF